MVEQKRRGISKSPSFTKELTQERLTPDVSVWEEEGKWFFTRTRQDELPQAKPAVEREFQLGRFFRIERNGGDPIFVRAEEWPPLMAIKVEGSAPLLVNDVRWPQVWSVGFTTFRKGRYFTPLATLRRHRDGRHLFYVWLRTYQAGDVGHGELVRAEEADWEPKLRRLADLVDVEVTAPWLAALNTAASPR